MPSLPAPVSSQPAALPAGHPPIGSDPSGGNPHAPVGKAIAWNLPKGWTEERGSGMRMATFKPPVAGKIDVSVIVLPGMGGGELGNVNRWRGQIGLGPLDEAAREKLRQEVKSKLGPVSLYDFTGQGAGTPQRMLAALLVADGQTWFVKMVGDEAPVAAARLDFVKLLESLHPSH